MARYNDDNGYFPDNKFGLKDNSDPTKKLRFDLSEQTTAVTRTIKLGPANNGTAESTVTATEFGDGLFHVTKLVLAATEVAVNDTNVGGGTKIYTFPQGEIVVLAATATLTPTTTTTLASTLNASKTISTGVGSVQTAAQASGTLATTEQDIVNQFSTTSSATINVAGTGGSGRISATTCLRYDGSTTAQPIYINLGIPTASDIDGDATVTVSGTVQIVWCFAGDTPWA